LEFTKIHSFSLRTESTVDANIHLKIGHIEFSGEGNQDWIEKQLDKIISEAERLVGIAPAVEAPLEKESANVDEPGLSISKQTLPAFLQEKNATKNQVTKFLATALWLQERGKHRLQTRDVTTALREANQTRLSNASDSLSSNVKKGYCERDGKEFFVTDEGARSL
jgi:hypothetical protein